MLVLTYEVVLNGQPEQGSQFPADRVLSSRKGDGKSGESVGRSRACGWEIAQENRTDLEQRSPQADRRRATTTLGESAEASRQASQVVNCSPFSQAPQTASFGNL